MALPRVFVREDGDGRDDRRRPGHDRRAGRPAPLPLRIVNQSDARAHRPRDLRRARCPERPAPCSSPARSRWSRVPAGADTSNTSATGGAKGTGVVDVRNLSVAPGATRAGRVRDHARSAGRERHRWSRTSRRCGSAARRSRSATIRTSTARPIRSWPATRIPTRVRIVSGRAVPRAEDLDRSDRRPERAARRATRSATRSRSRTSATRTRSTRCSATRFRRIRRYVAGSTTLNGAPSPTAPAAARRSSTGIPIYAPGDPTPGVDARRSVRRPRTTWRRSSSTSSIDAGVIDGTVISNQGVRRARRASCPTSRRTIPATAIPDDPTRDVVGNEPLLFAPKAAALSGGQRFDRIRRSGRRAPLHDHGLQPVPRSRRPASC